MDVEPPGRPRRWDHAVIAVRDLDAAARVYDGLGFSLTEEERHPFGTVNRLALLETGHLELVTVRDESLIPAPTAADFGFAAFIRRYLAHREGVAMMALRVKSAADEARRYAQDGLIAFAPRRFGRDAHPPSGETPVAFLAAHAVDPRLPDLALFACERETPETVRSTGSTGHANGARNLIGPVIRDEAPTDHHIFYASVLGLRDMRSGSSGLGFAMDEGEMDVLIPPAIEARYGLRTAPGSPRIEALRIAASSSRIIAPEDACGAALIFEETPA